MVTIIWEPLYDHFISNLCYNEECYKDTTLYLPFEIAHKTVPQAEVD